MSTGMFSANQGRQQLRKGLQIGKREGMAIQGRSFSGGEHGPGTRGSTPICERRGRVGKEDSRGRDCSHKDVLQHEGGGAKDARIFGSGVVKDGGRSSIFRSTGGATPH